jgi:hypothetical protein
MDNNLQAPPEPSLTALVSGIIADGQELFKQQLELVRTEISSDLRKTKEAAQALAIGFGIGAVAVVLLTFMLVHLLHWATEWPVWTCFGIVGGLLAVVAGALCLGAIKRFQSFNPLPDESYQAIKENLQWKTNPR